MGEKKKQRDWYRIAVIALAVLAAMTILYGILLVGTCDQGVRGPSDGSGGVTYYYSGELPIVRSTYGFVMVIVRSTYGFVMVGMGFLLFGICAWLHGRRKGGAVMLGAFFSAAFIAYLVYRFWLRRAHEGLPILGTAAWIHMICMLAVMAGSVWFFGFRKEKAEEPVKDAKEEKKEP